MTDPLIFISRNRIKDAMLEDFRQHYLQSLQSTQTEKPGTLVQLAYVNEETAEVVIVRLFPDAAALDAQLKGADQRSKEAYRFIEPTGVEIYGTPNPFAMEMMQKVAGSGIEVRLFPRYLGGFIHVSQTQGDQAG